MSKTKVSKTKKRQSKTRLAYDKSFWGRANHQAIAAAQYIIGEPLVYWLDFLPDELELNISLIDLDSDSITYVVPLREALERALSEYGEPPRGSGQREELVEFIRKLNDLIKTIEVTKRAVWAHIRKGTP